MPINDLALSEACTRLAVLVRSASEALNNGSESDAFKAFMAIESAAHTAQQRLNTLKYGE